MSRKSGCATSALGQKQTSEHDWIMSALPPKADMELSRVMSALCQKRTFCAAAELTLFDYLVGAPD